MGIERMRGDAPLVRTRVLIDAVDDGLVLLLAVRHRLARQAARDKLGAGMPAADPRREARVRARALGLASRVGLPAATAQGVLDVAIADARACQGLAPDVDQGAGGAPHRTMPPAMEPHPDRARRWLRLLPPPARWAFALRACPPALQRRLLERGMARVLAVPLQAGALDFLRGRRLGIEVPDLGLHWVVTLDGDRLRAIEGDADASVRGSATDLLLLAGRLEDADTLFFQRRLVLTGDTELGLTARNLLDRLPWEQVPLALRIALNRGARFARAAREACHAA